LGADLVRTSRPARRLSAVHPSRIRPRRPAWARLADEDLLDLRLCDLGLILEGTVLEARRDQLYGELEQRGLRFRPHCWLSDEWFSPTTTPGIAVPFYLAHPRLMRLEARQMGEVEGGTQAWCMQLLRHEAGHAFESAYRLGRRTRWQRTFGQASSPYPDTYTPRPSSRNFVLHLDWWYAQSHPSEDFAETFAVWLTPGCKWRKRYEAWPALRKLEYVDHLMGEIARPPAVVRSRAPVAPLRELRTTLREHYERRWSRYEVGYRACYDLGLRRLFSSAAKQSGRRAASAFLRHTAPELRRLTGAETTERSYAVNIVLKDMITRCRELDLRVSGSPEVLKREAATLLAIHAEEYLQSLDLCLAV
jgi:hypothetical protein